MKKSSYSGLAAGLLMFVLAGTATATPITFTFSDKDFLAGASWGTMTIDTVNASTLSVRYDASATSVIPAGSQATAFKFGLSRDNIILNSVTNPVDNNVFNWDSDNLNWLKYNGNQINNPTPANVDQFPLFSDSFRYISTEGQSNTMTVPGILPGTSDIFYLNFNSAVTLNDITWTGVRLLSLPNDINGGSLMLIGGPSAVPEPGTIVLLGAGLLGLGLYGRKRAKK